MQHPSLGSLCVPTISTLLALALAGCSSDPPDHASGGAGGSSSASDSAASTGVGSGAAGGAGGSGGAPEHWSPPDTWPTTTDDPVAAGELLFQVLHGQWRLDLAPSDTQCSALDCPGEADGWDPTLAEAGDYDVSGYLARINQFPPATLWRAVDASKTTHLVGDELGVTYGVVTNFYRRAIDGRPLLLLNRDDPATGFSVDFGDIALSSEVGIVRVVASDPLGLSDDLKLQILVDRVQGETGHITVVTPGFAFDAQRVRGELAPYPLVPPYDGLQPGANEQTLVDLLVAATASGAAVNDGVVGARVLELFDHESPAVRNAAIDYTAAAYFSPINDVPRLSMQDRIIWRMLVDDDAIVRSNAAETMLYITVESPDSFYHCMLHQGATECAASDADAGVKARCQQILDLALAPYGHCPW
jgi:hypothetical protein